jgi:glycine cleavage system T protein (aminomethyltransferase)
LKQTPLHSLHRELGAKFGPFAGYDMPLFYPAGILAEHRHTRAACGLFDISHMVQVVIEGPDAAALVSHLCPYPAQEQANGRARYSFFLNDNAGIIDDLIVTRLGPDRFMIVCNAGCADKDIAHINDHARKFDVRVTVRDDRAFLAVQGPLAETVLRDAGMTQLPGKFLDAMELPGDRFVSRSGYTGEDGFEIALPAAGAEAFARKLLSDNRAMMIGLGARDSLRLEAGLPLYGQDLGEDITPMEAGLAWAIPASHRAGGSFVGATALAQKFAQGRQRKRIALVPEGTAPVRAHAGVHDADGNAVGEVTSGGFGPTVNHPVALALVSVEAGEELHADLRGRRVMLKQVKLPFVQHRYKN